MTAAKDEKSPWCDILKLCYAVAVDLMLLGALLWVITAPFWLTAIVLLGWRRCGC